MYRSVDLSLNDEQDSMKQSFQDGVNTIYNKIVSCGVTPSNKTPTGCSNGIQSIYNNRYNEGYEQGVSEGVGSNVVLIGGGYGNRSGFNFSKSGLSFKKCLLVYSFSAYYMRSESDGWGIISATGITLSLLSKQWFNTYRNTGLAMFIYNGTDVQDTITVTAKAEDDGTTSAMVVYCIY